MIDSLEQWWPQLQTLPMTLCYADPQPRNFAMCHQENNKHLCLFDLETIEILLPQRDVMELLVYVSSPDISQQKVVEYLEYYRQQLQQFTGQEIDAEQHLLACKLCLQHLILSREAFKIAFIPALPRSDIERIFATLQGYLAFFHDVK